MAGVAGTPAKEGAVIERDNGQIKEPYPKIKCRMTVPADAAAEADGPTMFLCLARPT